jgi:hypothetical protein
MKISLPYLVIETVGNKVTYSSTKDYLYFDPERPNVYSEIKPASYTPIREARLKTAVVFDYDFKAAQRITAVGQMVALSVGAVVAFGILIPVNVIGIALNNGAEALGYKLGDLLRALGAVPGDNDLRSHYAALIQKVRG